MEKENTVKVNKSGFEIRSELIDIAAEFVKWQFGLAGKLGVPTVQDVITVAHEFNDFVINKASQNVKVLMEGK